MDANKKIDLVTPQCPNESKILKDILNHHPLRFSLDKFKFFLDTKEFKFSLADSRRVFQLPQATDNNNVAFVAAPNFNEMLPLFKNELGFSLPLHLPTNFVTKGLPQPWQRLRKIFARCLTTRAIGHDQPPFQIMQIIYCFINNVHVDYAELLWEGLHYFLMHPTGFIPYLMFTKIIVDHFMTANPNIPKIIHEHYHRVANDEIVKSVFKSKKNKEGAGMRIPYRMLTKEMKLTRHY
nr:hypothetical protein [Tanacetum cinerariifolium]